MGPSFETPFYSFFCEINLFFDKIYMDYINC